MHDGRLLLLAVLRGKSREDVTNGALVDYILDHLPGRNEKFRIDAQLRVRKGAVVVTEEVRVWRTDNGGRPVPVRAFRIECFHSRGNRGCRSMTGVVGADDPRIVSVLRQLFAVFRS